MNRSLDDNDDGFLFEFLRDRKPFYQLVHSLLRTNIRPMNSFVTLVIALAKLAVKIGHLTNRPNCLNFLFRV